MTKFNKTLIAAALALGAGSAYAVPSFSPGANSIYFNSLENQYRSATACAALPGTCLSFDSNYDPAGGDWLRVVPNLTGPTSVMIGDVFAGVISVQNIAGSNPWSADINGSNKDMFTGYLAQEVTAITTVLVDISASIGFPPGSVIVPYNNLTLSNPSTDPFNILANGGMFRLYSDVGAAATYFDEQTGGTAQQVINLATDGTYWGTLGLGGVDTGYAYSIDNPAVSGTDTNSKTENFTAVNVLDQGPAYSAGDLKLINDINESLVGGISASQICTPLEVAQAGIICAEIVGTAEIEKNTYSQALSGNYGLPVVPGASSPFIFAGNDPLTLNRIPEPASLALVGLGLIGFAAMKRRRAA